MNRIIDNHHPDLMLAGVSVTQQGIGIRLFPILAWVASDSEWQVITVMNTIPVSLEASPHIITTGGEALILNRGDHFLYNGEWLDEDELSTELMPEAKSA